MGNRDLSQIKMILSKNEKYYVNNNIHKNRVYLFTVFCGYCG